MVEQTAYIHTNQELQEINNALKQELYECKQQNKDLIQQLDKIKFKQKSQYTQINNNLSINREQLLLELEMEYELKI